MRLSDSEEFKGIEILSIAKENKQSSSFLSKLINYFFRSEEGVTLIGNASLIKKIKRERGRAVIKI